MPGQNVSLSPYKKSHKTAEDTKFMYSMGKSYEMVHSRFL